MIVEILRYSVVPIGDVYCSTYRLTMDIPCSPRTSPVTTTLLPSLSVSVRVPSDTVL